METSPANRSTAAIVLLFLIVVVLLGVAAMVWRADQRADEDRERSLCLQRIEATAAVAQLVPGEDVDREGRLDAFVRLRDQLADC